MSFRYHFALAVTPFHGAWALASALAIPSDASKRLFRLASWVCMASWPCRAKARLSPAQLPGTGVWDRKAIFTGVGLGVR